MKLQEYFNQHKEHYLSDIEKINIYDKIMHHQMKRSFHRKRSVLHVKSFVYTSFIVFVLLGFYGMYFFQQNQTLDTEGIVFNQFNENSNVAQADYIAKVVDFDGTFYIESKEGKMIQTSNINNGDIVILKENSNVVFHINSGTKAKITGPAKFVLEKTNEHSYKLNLLYGEYMEMSSLQAKNTQNIQVSVDDITVSQGETTKPINFQLIKQGTNHVIKNNGAKLLVTSQDTKSKTSVEKKQVLAIQGNDISLFDSFDKFAKAVKNKDLSQTFTLNDIATTKPTGDNETPTNDTTIKALEVSEIMNISEESEVVSNETESNISEIVSSDEQKVATFEQTKLLQSQLSKSSVSQNIQQLTISYRQGKDREFERDLSIVEKRITTIAQSFGFTYAGSQGTPKQRVIKLSEAVRNINTHIQNTYLLPEKYFENLPKIAAWLGYIGQQGYSDAGDLTTNEIIEAIPANIKF